ncbi:MAG TPA: membrane protein insertase YidC [Oleiagrimonas sp.]|nr:membrane protein insertase YidC [Oleiagrimonas sp.]
MNQTRSFLLLALAFVAYLLFNQWMSDYHKPPTPPPAESASVAAAASAAVPASAASVSAATSSERTAALNAASTGKATQTGQLIKVSTDVLTLTIDTRGGTLVGAHLLKYPAERGSKESVRLFNNTPDHYYEAQSGLIGVGGDAAPNHTSVFQTAKTSYSLAPGQKQLTVKLHWTSPSGVKVVKRYTLTRGSYAIKLTQTIDNGSNDPWRGQAYHQFERVMPPKGHVSFLKKYAGAGNYGFFGAAWYGPEAKFNQVDFEDIKNHPLNESGGVGRKVTGGWIAMEETYFVGAWLPGNKKTNTFSTVELDAGGKDANPHYLIRSVGPLMSVAPGQTTSSSARLFVGPKLPHVLESVAPHFDLALNYGMMTIIARPLHWVLANLYTITGNWGWAIVLLVILINALIYKLNAMQYRSSAHMRRLKPRMDSLKERFGDDKQKLQQATMELYKKEKVNPMAGCLPVLVTLPVFFGLYELLRQSVELRQAPFIFWIHDLSAADPYFILPALYAVAMLIQSMMMPMTPGMGATQQKMMRYMPVAYAVFFAFFPAGLALYYIVNTICRLLTQWWVYRQVDHEQARKEAAKAK